jgi:high affinity Mn2+ porin
VRLVYVLYRPSGFLVFASDLFFIHPNSHPTLSLSFLSTLSHRALATLACVVLSGPIASIDSQAQSPGEALKSGPSPSSIEAPSPPGPIDESPWSLGWQATYVWQNKSAFQARYTGLNSLLPNQELSYSFTATGFIKYKPWTQGEFELHPEAAQGVPLSRLTGLGGLSNGELARTSGANLTVYRARAFYRHRLGEQWVVTGGNFSALDVFDGNDFAHDPRLNFLNWSFLTHGAWDYPADARGYSWGGSVEYLGRNWSLRFGRFILPKESNGLALDPAIFARYGDVLEWEKPYQLGKSEAEPYGGKIRLMAFRNTTRMGSFEEATQLGRATGTVPDLSNTREMRTKVGVGVNVQQQLGRDLGGFLRWSWADGKSETYAFTEIDSSMSLGAVLKGTAWSRPQDSLGFAVAVNRISGARQAYLAAGGQGFFLGDGRLSYAPERIYELIYQFKISKNLSLAFDYQRISAPAYNADRGPVSIFGLRAHIEQ